MPRVYHDSLILNKMENKCKLVQFNALFHKEFELCRLTAHANNFQNVAIIMYIHAYRQKVIDTLDVVRFAVFGEENCLFKVSLHQKKRTAVQNLPDRKFVVVFKI